MYTYSLILGLWYRQKGLLLLILGIVELDVFFLIWRLQQR